MINSNTDSIYSFFSTQIEKAEYEIRENSLKLKMLYQRQTDLKRGKAYLVQLRREYVESKEPKVKKQRKTGG